MNPQSKALMAACLVAALVSFVQAVKPSPCPEQFQYEGGEQGQQWEGTLKLATDDELQGLWIRVKFDTTVKEIVLPPGFDGQVESRSPTNDELLIKNPNFVLSPKSPTNVRIIVKYDGNKVPSLTGYRLNARTVCPEQGGEPADIFQNDVNSKDFLSEVLIKPKSSSLPKFECGKTSPKSEYPWQAAIFLKENDKSRYLCEATLITPRHVLTAAHCVTYRGSQDKITLPQLSVSFGKSDLNNEVKSKQDLGVVSIKVHPGYQFANLLNDIAVVELSSNVNIDDFVRPICLPELSGEAGLKNVIVGYTLDKSLNIGSKLESVEVKEIKADECEQRLADVSPLIGDNTYCASYISDESRCVGDSGSGAASLRSTGNVWELRGIVTLGVALQDKYVCNKAATVVLTGVPNFTRWIRAATL